MSVFGSLITGSDVEAWVTDTLQTWMATYLGEMERRTGRPGGSLQPPRSYVTVNELVRWPEEQIPAVIIVSPGLADEPARHGDGGYTAGWVVDIGVIVSASSRQATSELAKVYAVAVRAALLQHRSLGGRASGVSWVDESYDDLPAEQGRTLAAGLGRFHVRAKDVVNSDAGTANPVPPPDPVIPPGDWPTVREDGVTITTKPGDQA